MSTRSTLYTYEYYWRKYLEYLSSANKDPATAGDEDIIAFISRYRNDITRVAALYALRHFYREMGVDFKPAKYLEEYPYRRRQRSFLTEDAVESIALSHLIDPASACMVALIYEFGLRAGEVGLVKIQDIDLAGKKIYIRRSRGAMETWLEFEHTWAYQSLYRYLSTTTKPRTYLFEATRGKTAGMGYTHDTVWKKVVKATNHIATPSDLRYSRMVEIVITGGGIEKLMKYTGIKSRAAAMRIYEDIEKAILKT